MDTCFSIHESYGGESYTGQTIDDVYKDGFPLLSLGLEIDVPVNGPTPVNSICPDDVLSWGHGKHSLTKRVCSYRVTCLKKYNRYIGNPLVFPMHLCYDQGRVVKRRLFSVVGTSEE